VTGRDLYYEAQGHTKERAKDRIGRESPFPFDVQNFNFLLIFALRRVSCPESPKLKPESRLSASKMNWQHRELSQNYCKRESMEYCTKNGLKI